MTISSLPDWRYVVESCVNLSPKGMHTLVELKNFYGLVMLKNEDDNAMFPQHGK